jgi:ribA/ribD-fused uncharacterized protein
VTSATSRQPFPCWASNFYQWPLTFERLDYDSAESAFQAHKTLDPERRLRFTLGQCQSPSQAKLMGRRLPLRGDWEQVKDNVMLEVLRAKFAEPELAVLLASHGDLLVEWNTWHDNYWGVCVCGRMHCRGGQNRLGSLLSHLRVELRMAHANGRLAAGSQVPLEPISMVDA